MFHVHAMIQVLPRRRCTGRVRGSAALIIPKPKIPASRAKVASGPGAYRRALIARCVSPHRCRPLRHRRALGSDVALDMIAGRIALDMRMAVVGCPRISRRRPRRGRCRTTWKCTSHHTAVANPSRPAAMGVYAARMHGGDPCPRTLDLQHDRAHAGCSRGPTGLAWVPRDIT